MALFLLIRAQMSATHSLEEDAFTKQNYNGGDNGNDTISIQTPLGVLGGSVAAQVDGDYLAGAGDGTLTNLGLFANDAAGAPYDNLPELASGKDTIVQGQAVVEVDVYETHTPGNTGSADITYVVGEKLYSSVNGYLSNAVLGDMIGICTKVPTTESPTLGLNMRI